jgi:hypothetical protein
MAATTKGGDFLIKESNAAQVFISEEFNEEQQMMLQMCRQSRRIGLVVGVFTRSLWWFWQRF